MYSENKKSELKRVNKKYTIIDIIISVIVLIIFLVSMFIVDYTNKIIFIIINCITLVSASWFIIFSLVSIIIKNKALIKHFDIIFSGEEVIHNGKIVNIKKSITVSKNIVCDLLEVEEDGIIFTYNVLVDFKIDFKVDEVIKFNTVNNFVTCFEVSYE